jgi:hypothetical protein
MLDALRADYSERDPGRFGEHLKSLREALNRRASVPGALRSRRA